MLRVPIMKYARIFPRAVKPLGRAPHHAKKKHEKSTARGRLFRDDGRLVFGEYLNLTRFDLLVCPSQSTNPTPPAVQSPPLPPTPPPEAPHPPSRDFSDSVPKYVIGPSGTS